jgi:L-2,4-diaminobutyrate decarboxylase
MKKSLIEELTSPAKFEVEGKKFIEFFSRQLSDMQSGEKIKTIPNPDLTRIREHYLGVLRSGKPIDLDDFIQELFNNSMHLHDPRYIGHQVSPPYREAIFADWASALLNNGSAVSEMGQGGVAVEQAVIDFLLETFGLKGGGGILTSGGSLGNLTALLAMREMQNEQSVWEKGGDQFAVLVSEESHYSVQRAVRIMGWGDEGLIKVPTDQDMKMDSTFLEKGLAMAKDQGRKVLGIVANSCSTSTGVFDPLITMGEFARKNGLWFHVDAAHGGAMIFSNKHRKKLAGIHLADSIVFDFHKLLHSPSLVSAVLYRNRESSFSAFSQSAKYLWRDDLSSKSEDFEIGKRTLECTRDIMGAKAFVSLAFRGGKFLEDHIDHLMELTDDFSVAIKEAGDFQLALEPEANILCFRYIGFKSETKDFWIENQSKLRNSVVDAGNYYIVKTEISSYSWLRCTVLNPLLTKKRILSLLDEIRERAKTIR